MVKLNRHKDGSESTSIYDNNFVNEDDTDHRRNEENKEIDIKLNNSKIVDYNDIENTIDINDFKPNRKNFIFLSSKFSDIQKNVNCITNDL